MEIAELIEGMCQYSIDFQPIGRQECRMNKMNGQGILCPIVLFKASSCACVLMHTE